MIAERTLQEIQDRLDIVAVIGGYITVKKAGRNFKALCPFHPEKTPSFMVYPQKQFFICYGCGAGGDIFNFVMRHEHLEFPEAVRLLAERAGVAVPTVAGERSLAHPELYRAHEVAARFYHELLLTASEAQPARDYLKKRGLEPETWDTFGLGYAPNRWDGLLTRAREEKMAPEVLERSGLAIRREGSEGWYDRFRHRVIFPIWDSRGRVIGFGGRVLEDGATPKYMNSPETQLYTKGRVLYGLHLASPHIREKDFCIVVEGYMDLVNPSQHGIKNLVASMGTSLTPDQVQLIRRLTRHVVMVYDGDYAGQMATLRGLDLFLEAQMRVKVAALPGGMDPDSVIQKKGIEVLIRAIQESQDLFDFKLNLLKQQFDPQEMEGRIRICQEMLPTIKRVPSAIQRGEYIKRLGELLGVEESLLWAELAQVKLGTASWRPTLVSQPQAAAAMTAEDLLVGLLLEDPSRVAQVAERLAVEEIADPDVRQIVQMLLERWQKGEIPRDHRQFLSALPRESSQWHSRMARWLAWADSVSEKERVLEDLLQKIQKNRRHASLESLKNLIHQAEEAGDETGTARLIFEYNRLVKSNTVRHVEA